MKKTFIVLLVFVLICVCACTKMQNKDGTMKVVIGGANLVVYSVDLSQVEITEGCLSVLKYLQNNYGLEIEYYNGPYGAYLTRCGDVYPNVSNNEYICILTSVERDFDVSSYVVTETYEGVTLKSSGLGVSQMTIEKDIIIYIKLMTY